MAPYENSKFNIQNLLIGAGVILVIVAGFYYFKSQNKEEETVPPAEEIIVQEEGLVKKTGEIVEPLTEDELTALKEEVNNVLSSAGESISLSDLVSSGMTATAKRAFSDGKFYYQIEAIGLKPVEKGYYYESWLQKDGENLSTGRVSVDETGKGSVFYTASVDRSEYTRALISLEPEDGNPEPAGLLLEGSF